MWEVRIQHEGLCAFRVLKGQTQADAQWKATAQLCLWDARWRAREREEAARAERLSRQRLALHGRSIAAGLNDEIAVRHQALNSILASSLKRGTFLDWEELKDKTVFAEPPVLPEPPRTPPPQLLKHLYEPELTGLDQFLPRRRRRKERAARELFARDLAAWQAACFHRNQRAVADFCRRLDDRKQGRLRHLTAQLAQHVKVDETRVAFEACEKDAVEYFFSEVLSRSIYPDGFPEEATLQYIRASRTLVVEYELPSIAAWPAYAQMKYLPAQNVLHAIPATEVWVRTSYEASLHQIALRVLSEIFAHDSPRALDRIAFNGWVRSMDKATGNVAHVCLMSALIARGSFMAINLTKVDPVACFRKLKGVFSRSPLDLVPVRQLLSMTQEDERFLHANEVVDGIEDPGSLASMNRSEFETLIREAFEREFRKNRAQVRVAQTPHEHGHDAIA